MLRRTPIVGGLLALALAFGGTSAVTTYAKPPARAPQIQNCTYTQGYWKNHPAAWPVSSLTLGSTVYSKTQLAAIFKVQPNGDATYILAHQLIAALLNVSNGASDSSVRSTINDAQQWLTRNSLGSNPSDPARSAGISYASTLDRFNNGLIGPGHCGSEPVSTSTPAPTSAPTNTPAPTSAPTNTPAPTSAPTNTPAPTSAPTSTPAPTSAPTNTPAPTSAPTNTPAPTSAPTTGNIRGLVWQEDDCDMMPSANETPLANVMVELFVDDGDGWVSDNETAIGSTYTDAQGTYTFSNLTPGAYLVRYSGEWYTTVVTADLTSTVDADANVPVAPNCGT